MRHRFGFVVWLCGALLAGCHEEFPPGDWVRAHSRLNRALQTTVWDVMSNADGMELHSLAHLDKVASEYSEEVAGGYFHGYRILGSTRIDNAALRILMVRSFYQSAREGEGEMLCFMPHHGLSITRGTQVIDLVICFHCLLYQLYDGSAPYPQAELSRFAQPLFERIVAEAGLPTEDDDARRR